MSNLLRYVVVPGQWPEQKMKNLYKEVYNCWETTWSDAFKELGKPQGFLKSDSFTRQDFVGAIFAGDKCVALSFFRWADPKMNTFKSDSYFSNWSEIHIKKLLSKGDNVIVCSNFTIAKEARGLSTGFSMKDLLVGITLRTFLDTGADVLTGALRRDRHVNEACARWGGVEIAREIPSGHGDTVDLMGFYQEVIAKHPKQELSKLVEELWDSRTVDSIFKHTNTARVAA